MSYGTSEAGWRGILSGFLGTRPSVSPHTGQEFRFRCPSKVAELHFQALVEAQWRPTAAESSEAVDRSHIHRHLSAAARQVCRGYSVLDAEEAQSHVNLLLAQARWVAEAGVELLAVSAALTVEPETAAAAAEQERVIRDSVVDAARHQADVDRMVLLRDTILLDGGMARLWWLNGERGRLPELVKLDGVFEDAARLISAAARPEDPPSHSTVAADLVGKFLVGLEPHHRVLLLNQLGAVFQNYERPDLAEEAEAWLGQIQR